MQVSNFKKNTLKKVSKNLTDTFYLLGFCILNCLSATAQNGKPMEIRHADLWERTVTKGQAADKLRGTVILYQDRPMQ